MFEACVGKIVGQDGPSIEAFAKLWEMLTGKFGKEEKIAYGLINEPHEVDMAVWSKACQAAVTAIRGAGGKGMILIPGMFIPVPASLSYPYDCFGWAGVEG